MAVTYLAAFLVPMGLLHVVLFVVMTSPSVALPAEEFRSAAVASACDRRDATSTGHQHDSSSLTLDNNADHAPPHHRPRKNNAPGIRFEMTRRPNTCAGLLEESASRTQKFTCALERGSRRQRLLAGKKATADYLRTVTQNTAGKVSSDWKFPESAGVGEFLVPIYLGTPPQKASIIIDTGSDLTWIQSEPCVSCFPQVDPIFNPFKSSTYKRVPCYTSLCKELESSQCTTNGSCVYIYGYGDESTTQGYFSTESITVERTSGKKTAVPNFAFGASVDSSDSFASTKGEGILGLGRGKVSFPSQLGSLFRNKFSYCLVDWQSNDSVTSTMYFGDAAVPTGEVMYTPMVFNSMQPSFYYIRVVGISVGTSYLSINQSVFEIDPSGNGGTIIDSGTTITYLQREAYNKVAAAYKSQVKYPINNTSGSGLPLCFDTQGVSNPIFPTMEIHLDGAHLRLPTSNTFLTLEGNITCLAFMSAEDYPLAILGNIQQQNFDIVYDLENKRIGFKPADCASI